MIHLFPTLPARIALDATASQFWNPSGFETAEEETCYCGKPGCCLTAAFAAQRWGKSGSTRESRQLYDAISADARAGGV